MSYTYDLTQSIQRQAQFSKEAMNQVPSQRVSFELLHSKSEMPELTLLF